ncbi:MAG TPA: aryl-sulfate sulfotransferase [Candidatus Angelobacter sp.]|nr:aryl-sulfate sulfotransferase [Candidatus Angelobacter sp.]
MRAEFENGSRDQLNAGNQILSRAPVACHRDKHSWKRSSVSRARWLLRAICLTAILVPFGLSGCGAAPTPAQVSVSPFVQLVHLTDSDISTVSAVDYTIAPKPGSVSKPVHVEYSMAALAARGYVAGNALTVPVFGLYAGFDNQVTVELKRGSGSAASLQLTITTPDYVDPTGIYSHPDILTPRSPNGALGFSFMYIKSALGSPIIIDTDGEIRWAAPGIANATSSALNGDEFIIGDPTTPTLYRLRLDGTISDAELPSSSFTDFHHNIEPGKSGFLGEVDAASGGVKSLASNIIEFQDSNVTSIQNHWDLAAILTAYMSSQGDDAAAFVRPGIDWFHSNSAIYDPQDDSVIVSSRENFVIKLDYKTGAIIWILGDPTKYWFTFPSLRAKALTLAPGGLYPIGQHALSINPEGELMLFNDGLGSANQPAGASAGETRTFSAVSAYSIDEKTMTAQNTWNYDAGQTIFSSICSSAYESPDKSILVDYAVADNFTHALLVGLDPNHSVVFEFEYPTSSCNTSWNAQPIALDDLKIDR